MGFVDGGSGLVELRTIIVGGGSFLSVVARALDDAHKGDTDTSNMLAAANMILVKRHNVLMDDKN